MSITLELTELSPELEKQLSAMSEEERERFAISAMQRKLTDWEDDGQIMVGSSDRRPIPISLEAMDKILALGKTPPREPTERMKKALENHKRLAFGEAQAK